MATNTIVPAQNSYAGDEKFAMEHADESLSASSKTGLDEDEEFSPAEQKRIIRTIDRRLIITCGLMYCISLMDRTNLSAAAIAGMTVELRLSINFRYVGIDLYLDRLILT